MNWRAVVLPSLAAVTVLTAACDDDPTRTVADFSVACPTGTLNVNAPISLTFTQPVLASTVTGGNIVVTDVETGVEVPGSLVLQPGSGDVVQFVPSDPLPYQRELRLRVQNLLTAEGNAAIGVTVCELSTQLPPITELFWERVPTATGNELLGVSLFGDDRAYVASSGGPVFVRDEGDFVVAFHDPHFDEALDVSALSATRFFSAHTDIRLNEWHIIESTDGGSTVQDRLLTSDAVTRVLFKPIAGSDDEFGVAGGGTATYGTFFKWEPSTSSFTSEIEPNTANVLDIDFRTSLAQGAAVSAGVELPGQTIYGRVYVTSDSGRTWTELSAPTLTGGAANPLGSRASDDMLFYRGVAQAAAGVIFAVGGNGGVVRFTPGAAGTYTRDAVTVDATLTSIEPDNPEALAFTDIQFSPTDGQLGWLVGQQLVGTTGGVPQFQGLIYETTDGGSTWTRQGVIGAPGFGASFPALNRIDAFSSAAVWIVGDGGVVLRYSPQP